MKLSILTFFFGMTSATEMAKYSKMPCHAIFWTVTENLSEDFNNHCVTYTLKTEKAFSNYIN